MPATSSLRTHKSKYLSACSKTKGVSSESSWEVYAWPQIHHFSLFSFLSAVVFSRCLHLLLFKVTSFSLSVIFSPDEALQRSTNFYRSGAGWLNQIIFRINCFKVIEEKGTALLGWRFTSWVCLFCLWINNWICCVLTFLVKVDSRSNHFLIASFICGGGQRGNPHFVAPYCFLKALGLPASSSNLFKITTCFPHLVSFSSFFFSNFSTKRSIGLFPFRGVTAPIAILQSAHLTFILSQKGTLGFPTTVLTIYFLKLLSMDLAVSLFNNRQRKRKAYAGKISILLYHQEVQHQCST